MYTYEGICTYEVMYANKGMRIQDDLKSHDNTCSDRDTSIDTLSVSVSLPSLVYSCNIYKEREREGWMYGGREGGRERGREGGRERGREGGRERGREGGRERGIIIFTFVTYLNIIPNSTTLYICT